MSAIAFETPEDFLAHFGVKGMRWGRRKTPEEQAAAKAQKTYYKQAGKAYSNATGDAFTRRIERSFGSGIKDSDYAKLSTKTESLKTGHTLYRTLSDPNKDRTFDTVFASTNKDDAARYRTVLPSQSIKASFKPKATRYDGSYEATLKATKKLTGPSEKERVDTFISLLDTKSVVLKNGKTVTGREYMKKSGYALPIRRLDSQRLGQQFYHDFVSNQYMKNEPLSTAYFKRLRDKGYNFVADDNDRNVLSKEPIILLNPNGDVRRMKVRKITTAEVWDGQMNYKDIEVPTSTKGGD